MTIFPAVLAAPFACPDFDFRRCSYVALRPTAECGDYTISQFIDDYEEVQFQIGLPDEPTHCLTTFAMLDDAIDCALGLKAKHPHLRDFYNGEEIQAEFQDWRSFANLCAEWDDSWEVVEQVATGRVPPDHPRVEAASREYGLIGVAVRRVVR